MKERPILFKPEMVRAILEGRKTQTRRILKVQPGPCDHSSCFENYPTVFFEHDGDWACQTCGNGMEFSNTKTGVKGIRCPFGKVGEHLWVRETHCIVKGNGIQVRYKADGYPMQTFYPDQPVNGKVKWIPSIHMPRRASRLTLEITDIRIERLNDISEEDAMAEGVEFDQGWEGEPSYGYLNYLREDECFEFSTAKKSFHSLWESINGEGSWDSNPWVWAVSFKEVK